MTKVKRSYDASRRREQARARRLDVVLAARDLFERDGFRPTTIAAIAARAEVSAESIYKGFGSKAALAKAVFDLVIAGDDEPVPVAERPAMRAVRDEPDVRRKIAMFVDGLARRQARSAKVQILVRDVLWNYLAIDTYERLVLTQGWPLERYSRWLAHAITSAICP